MLAVSQYADGKGPCPFELAKALLCEEYGSFPVQGGLEQQDMAQLMLYSSIKAIYRVCMQFKSSGLKGMSVEDQNLLMEIAQIEYERDRKKKHESSGRS